METTLNPHPLWRNAIAVDLSIEIAQRREIGALNGARFQNVEFYLDNKTMPTTERGNNITRNADPV